MGKSTFQNDVLTLFFADFYGESVKHISRARPKEIKKQSLLLLISPAPRNEEGEEDFFSAFPLPSFSHTFRSFARKHFLRSRKREEGKGRDGEMTNHFLLSLLLQTKSCDEEEEKGKGENYYFALADTRCPPLGQKQTHS